ncbi:ubinuclein-1 [Mugil cephalus]|uniref:ubinuclein-1 n=1 Tax=Mugil cephalus TaxID=48193 RepID=UPI001FB6B447|nr:ubinuclein-1 [Mugil cephalus]
MAEARRVQLTTLSSDLPSSSSQTSAQKCPSVVLPGKETHSDEPTVSDTVRLVLSLFEPDEQNFPEFSYTQLIENQISQTKGDVPLSRFQEKEKQEHDEVAAIARKLEEKYGDKPKKKKKQQQQKKKDRIQDLIDIGYGYDEEDSFIDNSEAYDEFVPASLTTTFGGFYVNSGVLQFRQASDTETDDLPTEEKTLDMTKKRKLNEGQDKPKKKKQRGAGGMCLKEDAKFSTMSEIEPHDELKMKKKKAVKMLSVTSMLKKFQREKEKEREKLEKVHQNAAVIMGATTIPLFPADAGGGGSSGLTLTDPLLSLIGSTNDHALIQAASTVDFDIDLDSLLEVGEETLSPKSFPQTAETQLNVFSDAKAQNPNAKRYPEQIQFPSEAGSTSSPLPEGLPPGLEESIRKLTVAAKTSEGESKLKFFNPDINSILLDIELQCREQGGQLRSKVYTHLSSFLPCSRDTLLKRVKKLFNTHVGGPPDVEDPMQKLKAAIGRSMPEQIACFHEHCQAYEQVRISKASLEDSVEEKGGKKGGPKKLFKWNEEIRECFSHVLRAKMDKYKKEGKSAQEIEENLKILLDNEVKPLWPKGWMQSRLLIKESGKLLGLFTALPVKKIKSGKKPSSISSGSTLPDGCDSLQGTRSLSGELQGTDPVFAESLNVSTSESLGAQKQGAVKGEVKVVLGAGLTTPAESEGPPVNTTSAPTHSFLDLLADQALAHEQPLTVSQELLAVAVAKYKHSVQHWSLSVDTRSPPLPPAPPHSSPVDFPLNRVCQVTVPRLLLAGEGKRDDADEVHIISDDSDISTQ